MRTESQIKAETLIDLQPVGLLQALDILPWVVQVLHFLLLEKVKGK